MFNGLALRILHRFYALRADLELYAAREAILANNIDTAVSSVVRHALLTAQSDKFANAGE
jgi:hypothetical protein